MSTNPWFKHWGEASSGHTLSTLWANGDVEGIALFWLILELVCRFKKRDSEAGEITISWSLLSRETNWKPSKCRRVLARISPVSQIEMNEKQTGYVSFVVRNWLKYQDSRGGKRTAKKEQNLVRREKREERRERGDSETHRASLSGAPLFFLNLWNENRGSLREAVNINAKRKASCIARLKDNPSQDYWREVITRMANSKFCTGDNDRGWRADFDFLLKPDTHLKVMEGKYDDRKEIITQKLKNVLNGDIA